MSHVPLSYYSSVYTPVSQVVSFFSVSLSNVLYAFRISSLSLLFFENIYKVLVFLRFKLELSSLEFFQNFVTRRQLSESCYANFDPLRQTTKSVLSRGVTAHETWAHSWEP